MNLKELKAKLAAALVAAGAIVDTAEKAGRDFTAEERQQVNGYFEEAKGLRAQIDQATNDASVKKALTDLGDILGGDPDPGSKSFERKSEVLSALAKGATLGEQFWASDGYQKWLKSVARADGSIPDSLKGFNAPPVPVPDLLKSILPRQGDKKDIITGGSATSGGAFVETDYTGTFVPIVPRRITLLDLISRRNTGSDTVEFVRQTSATNGAAPTPEASGSAAGDQVGDVVGTKPQGDMAFEKVTATVKTIAEWVPATKRALADAGQLRGLIDQQLRSDLQSALEDQVMNGTNTGEELEGLENTPGTLSQAFVTDLFTTTRRAKTFATTAQEDGGAGLDESELAYALNPEDWEAIELTQDQNGRYYGEGPFRNTPRTLWQIPVVSTAKTPQGKGWLGRWRDYVVWDREQASISVSDSPYNFFVRNLVAILAEIRVAGAAIRPRSFIEIDLQTGS